MENNRLSELVTKFETDIVPALKKVLDDDYSITKSEVQETNGLSLEMKDATYALQSVNYKVDDYEYGFVFLVNKENQESTLIIEKTKGQHTKSISNKLIVDVDATFKYAFFKFILDINASLDDDIKELYSEITSIPMP